MIEEQSTESEERLGLLRWTYNSETEHFEATRVADCSSTLERRDVIEAIPDPAPRYLMAHDMRK